MGKEDVQKLTIKLLELVQQYGMRQVLFSLTGYCIVRSANVEESERTSAADWDVLANKLAKAMSAAKKVDPNV